MSTNSRPGRRSNVDHEAMFALALQRATACAPPRVSQEAGLASGLLARAGRVLPMPPGAAEGDQVPPT
jgi:hypothetical protein